MRNYNPIRTGCRKDSGLFYRKIRRLAAIVSIVDSFSILHRVCLSLISGCSTDELRDSLTHEQVTSSRVCADVTAMCRSFSHRLALANRADSAPLRMQRPQSSLTHEHGKKPCPSGQGFVVVLPIDAALLTQSVAPGRLSVRRFHRAARRPSRAQRAGVLVMARGWGLALHLP